MENKLLEQDHSVTLTATTEESEMRLDAFLTTRIPEFSRNYFQELIQDKFVTVNNATVNKSYRIKPEDIIKVTFRPAPVFATDKEIPEDIGIEVIHENKHFMVIYKPAGLLVHTPNIDSKEISVVDWLIKRYENIKDIGYEDRPGIVHRLDKDTSGLLILAKTHHAHAQFSKLFRDRNIHKTYYALVHGHPDRTGTVDFPISRDNKVRSRMTHTNPEGRPSTTMYEVEKYFDETTLLKVNLITGRTHQIRVHLAAIGHPIVGDAVYGRADKQLKRQALHAFNLSFEFDGKEYNFSKNIPVDMQACIDAQKETSSNW